jgi:hypothetical protein
METVLKRIERYMAWQYGLDSVDSWQDLVILVCVEINVWCVKKKFLFVLANISFLKRRQICRFTKSTSLFLTSNFSSNKWIFRTTAPQVAQHYSYALRGCVTIYFNIFWPCVISKDGKEESQLDATVTVYWKIQISSTCFGQQLCPSSGALDCAIQLVVCCTQYVASRWTPSPDHWPATYWLQHTTSYIIQSKAPEDGHNCCSKHIELNWIYQ